LIVYESRAIARYIATKYAAQGPALIPPSLAEFAHFEQAASVEQNNFDVWSTDVLRERMYKP
jgi:glutathione S-transferase